MGLPLRLLLVLSLCLALPRSLCAQSSYDLYGSARSDALGHATTASLRATGVHANPAARASLESGAAAFYARQGFGLSVLRYGATHVATPFRWGVLSGGASTFGFEDYRETHLSLSYARRVSFGTSRFVQLGITSRYHHTSIAGHGNAGALGINAGLLLSLLRSLRLGAHATNLTGSTLVPNEPIPRTLALGLQYEAVDDVSVLVDVFKDVRFPATVRAGLEVWPVSRLALRAGITTVPTQFTGGVGLRVAPLRAHIAVEQHQQLGWTPAASLEVQW